MKKQTLVDVPGIRIRHGNKEDLPEIYRLVKELAAYEKAADEVITNVGYYELHFAKGLFNTIVAEGTDGRLKGMMLFFDAFSTWKGKMLWLEDFVVEKDMRKKGIGKRLFEELIKYGKENGYELIKWEVLDWNTPAVKFYKKLGARLETNWWDGKYFLNE